MNSLEIAELVQSRHDSVKRTIERLADQEVIAQPPMVDVQEVKGNSRQYITKSYLFTGEQGKLDSITVVAQLCPHFTARMVKRWQELEQQVALQADPLNSIAKDMQILANGINTTLKQLDRTERYINLLELNQKGTIKITPEVIEQVKLMKSQGYSQANIGRLLRISPTSVSMIIKGTYPKNKAISDNNVTRMIETAKSVLEQGE